MNDKIRLTTGAEILERVETRQRLEKLLERCGYENTGEGVVRLILNLKSVHNK